MGKSNWRPNTADEKMLRAAKMDTFDFKDSTPPKITKPEEPKFLKEEKQKQADKIKKLRALRLGGN